ncbi:U-box domain-containing protein 33 [Linum grandiflorum]
MKTRDKTENILVHSYSLSPCAFETNETITLHSPFSTTSQSIHPPCYLHSFELDPVFCSSSFLFCRQKNNNKEMEMEGQSPAGAGSSSSSFQYSKSRVMSSEIVEIVDLEDNNNNNNSSGSRRIVNDVYVCVGRDDMDALEWAVDHISSPTSSRLFLVHVFPPLRYISTPVGRLAKNQLSKEQLRFYSNEENNRRRNLLQKYIRFCDDAKVAVDTMLLESTETGKAIVDLIPVLNITNLVLGAKLPRSRYHLMKKVGIAEFVKKNAPDYCQVTVVHQGKAVSDDALLQEQRKQPSRVHRMASSISYHPQRKLFSCVACFSGKV